MQEISLVTTAGLALAAIIGILVLVGWTRTEVTARGAEQDKRRAAEELRSKVERERDEALVSLTRITAERDQSRAEVDVYAAAAVAAREELTKNVRERLAAGSDDDVAAEVDRLLGAPLSSVRGAAAAAGDGGGGQGAGTVPRPG